VCWHCCSWRLHYWLPGDAETIEETLKFAQELDCETIQVSLAHAYPGTDFYNFVEANGYLRSDIEMTDETGHQLPHVEYPGLSSAEMMEAVEDFYGKYYFRPRIVARIVKKAIFERRRSPKRHETSAYVPSASNLLPANGLECSICIGVAFLLDLEQGECTQRELTTVGEMKYQNN